ncbi:MAG: molybdopterin-dependent oxidoreductase [Chloroflexi bacterium]|nr:molybdopterin-dependent oxidoreductase [Chloroflexota bacterium]
MALTRRQLLKLAGVSAAGAVVYQACGVPEKELRIQSPVHLPEDLVSSGENWYATLCRQCPGGEGIVVRVVEGRAKKVEGNPDYPVNQGKTSVRCQAGVQALYHPDRLQGPLRRRGQRGSGEFDPVSWEEALGELLGRLGQLRTSGRAKELAFLTDPLRGHLAFVVKRFTEAYGGQHLALEPLEDTAVRAAVKRVFGQDRLPDLDIQRSRYLLSFGADFLGTWLQPVRYARAYGEFRQGEKRKRGTFVQVEPRLSMTGASADEWVPVKPGSEGVLALSMAQVMAAEGLADARAVQAMTQGSGLPSLEAYRPERAAQLTGVDAARIRELARAFATNRPSLAIGGGPAAAHTNGLFNLTAILSLNSLVGSVGRPGGLIFNPPPPTPELATALPAAPFAQWKELADRLRQREVRVVLVRGANPVYGLPRDVDFGGALKQADYVVSFSSFMDETTAMADLVLPDNAFLESWGDDVPDPGPGYQVVGFQQPVVAQLYDSRSFGEVLMRDIAGGLGGDVKRALPWDSMRDLLRESARKLHALSRGSVRADSFEAFWNGVLQRGGWWDTSATASVTPPSPAIVPQVEVSAQFSGDEGKYPFHLLPVPSLSMGDGSGAHLPWLQATPDPMTTVTWQTWVEINAERARELGIREHDVVLLESPYGKIEARAYPNPATPPDLLAVPTGQGHQFYTRYAEKRGSNPLSLLAPLTDQDTGALAWAATRVRIQPTGQRIRLPKLEGTVTAYETEPGHVIQVTRPEA